MIKWHIFLSTLTLILMIIAGIQACLWILQDYLLRHAQKNHIHFLPSIETLEKYLFRTIMLAFILLIIIFFSSLIFFGNIFIPALREKSILTLAALSVLALLLIGRNLWGWRGRIAIRWTFAGMALLLMIYCGTGLLLHAPY